MGEVYRARDTRLKRDIALKVLPDTFAHDSDRLARFQREAELLATLNHPNIAGVYGLEQSDGVTAILLELVEGETLADLNARGPVAVADALPIARQIAEALEAAHDKGVVHRDLKPANIKVTPEGQVKVLDFGLAKALDPDAVGAGFNRPDTMSPTLSVHATYAGVILGTAAYMSPEQAKGKAVDRRADIWAFGVVLCEMLTGAALYSGETVPETLARVIEREPDLQVLPRTTPKSIRDLLGRCLTKDPRNRLQAIGEARIAIEKAIAHFETEATASDAGGSIRQDPPDAAWRRALPWAVAVALGVALVTALTLWAPWRTAASPGPVRLNAELGADDASLVTTFGAGAILSPDGRTLAFIAQASGGTPRLYIRPLDQPRATALSGTDGAQNPFFSPDGQWIAFFAMGMLKKISATGSAAITLCDAPAGRGGAWAEDGTIIFTPNFTSGTALMRVSSAGGTPQPLTTLEEGEATHRWPQVLPGDTALLYTAGNSRTGFEDANIVVQPLPNGVRKIVQRGGYHGRYLPSGHLVYMREGILFAAPFDLGRLELAGQSVPVLEGVIGDASQGKAQFAVSRDGTLVYAPGEGISNEAPIFWLDRSGKLAPLRQTPANWSAIHFAPDGSRIAFDLFDGRQTDVWVYEWMRDTLSRITFDPSNDQAPKWTPDGRRIAFASNRGGNVVRNLYWQRADGTGDVQRLTDSTNDQSPTSWHPNGRFLVFQETHLQTAVDLMVLPIEGDEASGWKPGKATTFLNSPAGEAGGRFSPDGRWLAYASNETGRTEVYVRPFPGPGGKWQVSSDGAAAVIWSRTRQELFYSTLDQRIMVAGFSVEGGSFRTEKPRLWWTGRYMTRPRPSHFDLHPDGERFALAPAPEVQAEVRRDHVTFIFNFFDELRRIAPVQ